MKTYSVLGAGLCASLVVAALLVAGIPGPQPVTLQAALNQPAPGLSFHLYSGAADPTTGKPVTITDHSVEAPGPQGSGVVTQYLTNKDRSTVDILTKPDGKSPALVQSYYPRPPGQIGRHPHVKTVYAKDKDLIVDQDARWISGYLQERSHTDESGVRSVVDFAEDGMTIVGEKWFEAPKCCDGPILKSEHRWRADRDHSLSHEDLLLDDGTRAIVDYDEHGRQTRIEHQPPQGIINGTTVVAYYPDGRVRLDSKTDEHTDTALYYRPDGTLSHKALIDASATDIYYFDATGQKLVLRQYYWRYDTTVEGETTSKYVPYLVSEYDASGEQSRVFEFRDGWVYSDEHDNTTVDGVPYKEVDFNYAGEGETLSLVLMWQLEVKPPPDRRVEHTPAENIHSPKAPADEMEPRVKLEDNLPIPPKQNGEHGS